MTIPMYSSLGQGENVSGSKQFPLVETVIFPLRRDSLIRE